MVLFANRLGRGGRVGDSSRVQLLQAAGGIFHRVCASILDAAALRRDGGHWLCSSRHRKRVCPPPFVCSFLRPSLLLSYPYLLSYSSSLVWHLFTLFSGLPLHPPHPPNTTFSAFSQFHPPYHPLPPQHSCAALIKSELIFIRTLPLTAAPALGISSTFPRRPRSMFPFLRPAVISPPHQI